MMQNHPCLRHMYNGKGYVFGGEMLDRPCLGHLMDLA